MRLFCICGSFAPVLSERCCTTGFLPFYAHWVIPWFRWFFLVSPVCWILYLIFYLWLWSLWELAVLHLQPYWRRLYPAWPACFMHGRFCRCCGSAEINWNWIFISENKCWCMVCRQRCRWVLFLFQIWHYRRL